MGLWLRLNSFLFFVNVRMVFKSLKIREERNWFFTTHSVLVKPISLQPYDVNLWYFKLTLFDLIAFIVWNIKDLRHWVAKILKLENQSLWQKVNFFVSMTLYKGLPQKWEFWDDCTFTKTLKLFLFCAIIYQNIRRLQDSNIYKAVILYG